MAVPGTSVTSAAATAAGVATASKSVQRNISAMQAGMADAVLTLATGGSKLQAVLNGVGSAITLKVLGPLGYVAGISFSALRGITALAKGFAQFGMGSAASMEMVRTQLQAVLRSAELARDRLQQIRRFSDVTPFKFGDVANGNKALEMLSKGALSSRDGMNLVGDAASVAGTKFSEMSEYVGRAYDGLASGRPIGEVLMRLQELGVVSGTTRNQIEHLSETGGTFAETWGALERDLKRSQGAMETTGQTLEGLQSTLEDTKDAMAAGFSGGFLEGEKTSIKSMTESLERLTPVTDYYGRVLGKVISVESKFKAELLNTLTSIPGVNTALKALGTMFVFVNASILGVAVANLAKWTATAVRGGASAGALTSVLGGLRKAGGELGSVFAALAAGNLRLAGSNAAAAAGTAASAVKMGGMSAVLQLLQKGVGLLGTGLVRLAGLLATPIGIVAAFATGLYLLYDHFNETTKALEQYNNATDDLLARHRTAASLIKNLDDLTAEYTATINDLTAAYKEAAEASAKGDTDKRDLAMGRAAGLEEQRKRLQRTDTSTLEKSKEVYQRREERREEARGLADQARSAQQGQAGPQALVDDLESQLEAMRAQRKEADGMLETLDRVKQKQAAAANAAKESAAEHEKLAAAMAAAQKEAEYYGTKVGGRSDVGFGGDAEMRDAAKHEAALKKIAELEKQQKSLGKSSDVAAAALAEGLSSGNDLAVLRSKINLYEAYDNALRGTADAETNLKNARRDEDKNPQGVDTAVERLKQAVEYQKKLEGMAGASGVTLGRAGADEHASNSARLEGLKKELEEKAKLAREADAEIRLDQARLDLAQHRLEVEMSIKEQMAQATENSYQAEQAGFQSARERLDMEVKIASERANAIAKEASMRAQLLRRDGKENEAGQAEQAGAKAAESTRRQAEEERAQKLKVIEAQEAMAQRVHQQQQADAASSLGVAQMNLEAAKQRRQGNLAGAQALESRASALQEEVERPGLQKKYQEMGYGSKEAAALADKDIQGRRATREDAQAQERREAGQAQSASSGQLAAERMRTSAMAEETKGHLDLAEALREAAVRTEKASTRNQRIDEMAKREGISKEAAGKKVDAQDREEQKQRQAQIGEQKKKRDLAKQGVTNESKARKLELSGNKEAAERVRDKQREKERAQELKDQGIDDDEAKKQAHDETRDEQRKRQQQQQSEYRPPKAEDYMRGQKVSPMQRIGGGGGVYGAGVHTPADFMKKMDKIIDVMQHRNLTTKYAVTPRLRL